MQAYDNYNSTRLRGLELISAAYGGSSIVQAWTINTYPTYPKNVSCYEINYVSQSRNKRMFALIPYDVSVKNKLIIGLPGSNSTGDGAKDLFEDPNGYQKNWLLHLSCIYDTPAIAIDGPLFGSYPYTPIDPHASLIDDLCGVEAYKDNLPYGLNVTAPTSIFIGGCSWGAIRTSFLAPLMSYVSGCYLASSQLCKTINTAANFNPPDWIYEDFNYKDMITQINAKVRLSFGDTDHMYDPFPQTATALAEIVAANPTLYSSYIIPAPSGHEVDLTDMINFYGNL